MILLSILLSTILGCTYESNENFKKESNSSIYLSNSTELNFTARTLFEYANYNNRLTLLCLEGNVISYFDLEKKNIYKRDTLSDLINKETTGMKLYGKYLYISASFPYYIYKYDIEKNQITDYSTPQYPQKAVVPPVPFLYGTGNILVENNKLFLPGKCYGEGAYKAGDRPTGVCLDLQSKEVSYFMDYPKMYYQGNWGGMYYRDVYATGNSDDNELVFSFPACHELYIYNVISKVIIKESGGSNSFESIKPFSKDVQLQIVKIKDEVINYYFKNYSYSFIVFDKKRKLYYRMVEYPNINFGKMNDFSKPRGIIILDEFFKFLGESKLPEKTYSNQIIVTDKGVIIPTYNKKTQKRGYDEFQIKSKL